MNILRETLESFDGTDLFSISLNANAPRSAVLFLHGIGEESAMYDSELKLLQREGHSTYAMDLRGHGKSPGSRNLLYSYDDIFEDLDIMVARIREREGAKVPLFIVGYGFGGLVAACYIASERPSVNGLICCGSAPKAKLHLFEQAFKSSISLMMPEHSVKLDDMSECDIPIRTIMEIDRLRDTLKVSDIFVPVLYLKWGNKADILDDLLNRTKNRVKDSYYIADHLRNNQRLETIKRVLEWLDQHTRAR